MVATARRKKQERGMGAAGMGEGSVCVSFRRQRASLQRRNLNRDPEERTRPVDVCRKALQAEGTARAKALGQNRLGGRRA